MSQSLYPYETTVTLPDTTLLSSVVSTTEVPCTPAKFENVISNFTRPLSSSDAGCVAVKDRLDPAGLGTIRLAGKVVPPMVTRILD